MEVYAKSIDWAYSNPQAIEIFAKNMKVPRDIAKQGVDEYYPKAAMQIGEIRDLERSLKDALDFKFIPAAKTPRTSKACSTSSTSRRNSLDGAQVPKTRFRASRAVQALGAAREGGIRGGGGTRPVSPRADISTAVPQRLHIARR